jgi:hypothetical protein
MIEIAMVSALKTNFSNICCGVILPSHNLAANIPCVVVAAVAPYILSHFNLIPIVYN